MKPSSSAPAGSAKKSPSNKPTPDAAKCANGPAMEATSAVTVEFAALQNGFRSGVRTRASPDLDQTPILFKKFTIYHLYITFLTCPPFFESSPVNSSQLNLSLF